MHKPKLMVIGLDAVSLSLLDSFAKHCPTIRGQMAKGVSGHALPSFPVYTPTNWAVLSTGGDSSVTAAEGWNRKVNGNNLSTFDRRAIGCDTIFDAAGRNRIRTLAIAYPSAHPTEAATNMVLMPLDRGLVSNCLVPGKIMNVEHDKNGMFRFVLLSAPRAASGATLAKAVGATEDGADLGSEGRKAALRDLHAYLFRTGKATWKLGFLTDAKKAKYTLTNEQWSEPIPVSIDTPCRPGKCVLRVMVFDAGKRLAVSEAYDVGALGKPAELARQVYLKLGPPTEHSVFSTHMNQVFRANLADKLVLRLAREDLDAQAAWIVNAATEVMKTCRYDVFYLHHHLPDNAMHCYLAAAEGSSSYSPKQHVMARQAISMVFEICDSLVAGLLKLAGPKTTVLLVSDHGDVPNRYAASINNRLVETGLIVSGKDGSPCLPRSKARVSSRVSTWIEINAGRDTPEYGRLQAKVIDALLDWKTRDGERVIALALRRKDAHLLGYFGPECGDVVFHYNSGFYWGHCPGGTSVTPDVSGANHGPQMPVTFSKISDNMAFFVLSGPGIRKNVRWNTGLAGHVRLIDMVPTICYAAGLPTPRNATGAVRRDLWA